ncbi:Cytochrome P450 71A1, partial [Mucuna pruriens]
MALNECLLSTLYLSLSLFIGAVLLFNLARSTKTKTKSKSKSNLNLPPFPPKLPIIGNLHQFGTLPHRSLRDLSLKYGDVMMLQFGQKKTPSLVVSSAQVAREIMKTHDLDFSNRSQTTAAKLVLYECNDIGFGNYGEDWRQKKKICVHQFLSAKMVESFRVRREEEVAELVKKLREASSNDACNVDLRELFMSTPMNIIYKCVFGQNYSEHNYSKVKDSIRKAMAHLTDFTFRDHFPLLGWVDVLRGKIREYKSTFKALDASLDQAIDDYLTQNTHSKQNDFVAIHLQSQNDSMLNFQVTRNNIKSITTDMLVGGADTIASTIEWTISELVTNPAVMKKVQEEVRTVVGHKSSVEENDVNQMHYLKCVIKETLRLHPPSPLLAPRETISSLKLKGYDIPAKTVVFINAWAIHRDPQLWESPEVFLPERFENRQVDFKDQEYLQFIPFGFGRRGCPGVNFATATIEYALANLLYYFDWKLPETDTLDMTEIFAFVVSKKVPLHLKPQPVSF